MFWKSDHSRRHVSWRRFICIYPAPGNGSSSEPTTFRAKASFSRPPARPHLYIAPFSTPGSCRYQHGMFLSARVRKHACSGLYSPASPRVETARSLFTSFCMPSCGTCDVCAFELCEHSSGRRSEESNMAKQDGSQKRNPPLSPASDSSCPSLTASQHRQRTSLLPELPETNPQLPAALFNPSTLPNAIPSLTSPSPPPPSTTLPISGISVPSICPLFLSTRSALYIW